jgi:flagellar hook-length control protein FliK
VFGAPLQTQIAASAPSASTPTAPVATATLTDLASQTAAQVGSGASQFQITLTPEGLGQVSVTVNVAAEGKVSAAFAFERPETADALSGRASDLQKALEQAGFSLSESGLSFAVATPPGHGQGAGSQQNPGGDQGANQGGGGQGSGQGGQGQGSSGQGSNTAFAQTGNPGSGQGQGGSQGQSWTYGQAGALAFASASDAASAADQSPNSPYASRAASGLDIRI